MALPVPGLLTKAAEKFGGLPALNYKLDNKWVRVTYNLQSTIIFRNITRSVKLIFVLCFREYEQNERTVAKTFIKFCLEKYPGFRITYSCFRSTERCLN